MSPTIAIVVALVLLAGNAFFVGAEFALISARRSQIEPLAAAGSRRARTTLGAMENVSLMMACAQLGITACSLGLGAVGEPAVAHLIEAPFAAAGLPGDLLHPLAFAIALTIVVYLHMVLGEMVPKNIALAGPERSALALGPPLEAIARLLSPLIKTLNALANAVLRLMGVAPRDEVASAFTTGEVSAMIADSRAEGLLDDAEHQLLAGALTFEERTVASVLIPRERLTVLPVTVTPSEVQAATARTGYSRFPVAESPESDLAGYLHVKDVLPEDAAAAEQPVAAEVIRPLASVGAGDSLRAALQTMQTAGSHLARVSARDGDLAGVVALEDVLEKFVGEVRDAAQAATGAAAAASARGA